ncbi:hypothetical protein CYMTET_55602 [Cymbomonas tetramitiformis]|uniref:Uncharacterized protein n=1 Tax=Cymbomonas tetramitiformis TaxID=36881 RepID=A0AAE0EMM6_9CHLO|nr:hypothetical protein CYMTET_55602 [Cymbomonas tetramitiformis]
MPASFFKKRKLVTFEGEEERGGSGCGRGARLASPSRRNSSGTSGDSGGRLQNPSTRISLRVLFVVNLLQRTSITLQRLQQADEGKLQLKDGDLAVVPKTRKCKNMAEWERGFFRIMCEAPTEVRDALVDFLERAKSNAAEYNFYPFAEFYEHLRAAGGNEMRSNHSKLRIPRTTVRAAEAGARVEVLEAEGAVGAGMAKALLRLATATTPGAGGTILAATSGMFAVFVVMRVM